MGMLRIKLEEAKKENEILKAMLNQVNQHCTALQNRILFEMQQHQLSASSSSPRNNNNHHDSQVIKFDLNFVLINMVIFPFLINYL